MALLLYFPVDRDSRAASSYNKSAGSCVRLCQVCWEFDHGVPPARRRTGLVLVSLKDSEKKEGKGKSSGYVKGGPQKQLSRDLRVSGEGPLYVKKRGKMENVRRCPWTRPAPLCCQQRACTHILALLQRFPCGRCCVWFLHPYPTPAGCC